MNFITGFFFMIFCKTKQFIQNYTNVHVPVCPPLPPHVPSSPLPLLLTAALPSVSVKDEYLACCCRCVGRTPDQWVYSGAPERVYAWRPCVIGLWRFDVAIRLCVERRDVCVVLKCERAHSRADVRPDKCAVLFMCETFGYIGEIFTYCLKNSLHISALRKYSPPSLFCCITTCN